MRYAEVFFRQVVQCRIEESDFAQAGAASSRVKDAYITGPDRSRNAGSTDLDPATIQNGINRYTGCWVSDRGNVRKIAIGG